MPAQFVTRAIIYLSTRSTAEEAEMKAQKAKAEHETKINKSARM